MSEDIDEVGSEPSLDGLIKQLLDQGEGWADLDTDNIGKMVQVQLSAQKKAMKREAALFRTVFLENADGRKLLELMLDQTLRSSRWPVHQTPNVEMLQTLGIWNEAQCAFVMAIVEAIAVSENKEIKERNS